MITVEDPVELVHTRKRAMMSQREVGTHTRSFQAALKASLREDPDVIVVGELRDTETVRMALSASETGHLVLGTMNTPSAAKTIDRIIDLFPPSDQAQVRATLAGGLRLVVGQRLLPSADRTQLVAAAELLPGSLALWNLIRDSRTFQIPSLQQRGRGSGSSASTTRSPPSCRAAAPRSTPRCRSPRRPPSSRRGSTAPSRPRPAAAGLLHRRGQPRARQRRARRAGAPELLRAGRRAPRKARQLMALLDALLDELLTRRGSDLHLGIGYPPLLRSRGELVPLRDAPIDAAEMEALLFEITSPAEREKITTELDLDFAYAYGQKARFRANYFHKTTGLAAVFRTIPTKVLSLDELGCPEVIRRMAERRAGLVLVTGPTGSGRARRWRR